MTRKHPVNILLCSSGRRPYLARWFRSALAANRRVGRIIVADADPYAAARGESDVFLAAPAVTSPEYVDWLDRVLTTHDVGIALSVNDFELSLWSQLVDERRAGREALICLSGKAQRIAEDKLELSKALRSAGVRSPEAWTAAEVLAVPGLCDHVDEFVVKARFGSGSAGLAFADAADLHAAVRAGIETVRDSRGEPIRDPSLAAESVLVQPRLHGTEFGLDLVADFDSTLRTVFAREKIAMRNGETDKAITVDSGPFAEDAGALARIIGGRGVIDVDLIRDRRGEAWFLDVNPRFGGGYPFSHVAGADAPAALVAWHCGERPDDAWLAYRHGAMGSKTVDIARVS